MILHLRYLPALFIALTMLPAEAVAREAAQQDLGQQYASCTQLTRQQPEAAYKKARGWYQETGAMAAQHCMALALYEMGDYLGAANGLEELLRSITPGQGRLWLNMKSQTAKAYMQGGAFVPAERHMSEALRWASDNGLDKDMIPLLIQRGRIYALHNEHLRAIQDLDHALSIQHNHAVLLERARVFIKIGKTQDALADIKSVLKDDPLHEEASMLLGKVERRQQDLARKKQ